jgi:hypothetical protein
VHGESTGWIAVLAARTPKLDSALLAAKMAGYSPHQHRRHPGADRAVPHPGPTPLRRRVRRHHRGVQETTNSKLTDVQKTFNRATTGYSPS